MPENKKEQVLSVRDLDITFKTTAGPVLHRASSYCRSPWLTVTRWHERRIVLTKSTNVSFQVVVYKE